MSRTVHVRVTRADIAHGEPRDGHRCPAALAIRRYTEFKAVSVGTFSTWLDGAETVNPVSLTDFTMAFDDFGPGPVRPFEFDLVIPE